MDTAHIVPLEIYRGATFDARFRWDAGPRGQEQPVDLTGCTAMLTARLTMAHTCADAPPAPPAPLAVLTTQDGGITLGATPGLIRLHMSAAQTAALRPLAALERAEYDLLITMADGRVVRRMAGPWIVKQGATHV